MLPAYLVIFVALAYLAILFLIASRGEKQQTDKPRPWRYSLVLGVHCTTWAFYGTVTQAAHYGWWFAPTYLGGILIFLFAHGFLMKLLTVVKQQNLTSIADLLGSRYGKSHSIAVFVTFISLIALVPYIALQLRAVSASFSAITGVDATRIPWFTDVSAGVAVVMILFAILFGARKLSLSEKHPGLMDAVAFESIVKLVSFGLIGLFCTYQLFNGFDDLLIQAAAAPLAREALAGLPNGTYIYITHMLLGAAAMFLLPRQFHVNFIENTHADELKTARWAFPLYLFAINFFILPITLAGILLVPESRSEDMFMLALPVLMERPDISIIAFIGGLAAATSMVIMATLALSIMISNDVFTPLWLRWRKAKQQEFRLTSGVVLTIRRLTMVLIISLAYLYHEATESGVPLVSNGLIAMALLTQLGPALIGGLYWQRSSRIGAIGALGIGSILWIILLLLPSLQSTRQLTDLAISNGILISLSVNILLFVIGSLLFPDKANERKHAQRYLQPNADYTDVGSRPQVTWGKLRSVLSRFIDAKDTVQLDKRLGLTLAAAPAEGLVPPVLLQRVERELAGAVGSAASRLILHGLARTSEVNAEVMADWASEASRLYRFNRELLQASVENIPQGISVVDKDLRLVAWNRRYLQIFNYPDGFIHAGMPVVEILRYNAKRGLFGHPDADIQQEVNKRLTYLRRGSSYRYQRQHEGRVIELQGNPMPEGGFVTTYTDITKLVKAQEDLHSINQELENRVNERTQELTEANSLMELAKRAAEEAHLSKSRFFAAAGHDLMQPFNAASLFCEMLQQRLEQAQQQEEYALAAQIQQSLSNAEELLTMLLEMTKLESGNLKPDIQQVPLDDILLPLAESFTVLAHEKGLALKVRPTKAWVATDKRLLSRVIQNLISNAIRYTDNGSVLCGIRRRSAAAIELQIIDTGRGIPKDKQNEIFKEFHQLGDQAENPGLGLGLAIVERMCRLLQIPITLKSSEHHGTCFGIILPLNGWQTAAPKSITVPETQQSNAVLANVHILLLDNDETLRLAISKLLVGWGAEVTACHSIEEAMAVSTQPDLLFVDYHLDNDEVGVTGIRTLREKWQTQIPAILSTADPDESIREQVVEIQASFLPKPVKQAALLRLLKRLL
ncbi:sodium:proline symporter [Aliidiomarina iranensis]|uniref:histidine kinase n=1 Tax=Aliidiomarina iranensis TaxID=1434071 RepID=A0A432VR71_9GAMM|nr:PAS domain-containing hybrid sensor histidine kinase/response regulator [Aliidiomarina iranensis]RUO18747.1 sodium:proline symporter [Aliidiomarina iranensis]